MSNQRPGKVVRAADPTMKDMTTLKFFKNAQKLFSEGLSNYPNSSFEKEMKEGLKRAKNKH